MKKILCRVAYSLLVLSLCGCASFKSVMHPTLHFGKTPEARGLSNYNGPKAKVAVADFEIKTAKADATLGSELREILVTVLGNSHRFNVVERQTQSADLIITTVVTEFAPQASGGRSGIGGGGGAGSGRLGGLLGASLNKARMALDIRIVDGTTSLVLAAGPVQGQAADVSGSVEAGSLGNWTLTGGLSIYSNTPMEKAMRICIFEAVRYISKNIPVTYYKY